jgi:collagenase-like PrtC family protease
MKFSIGYNHDINMLKLLDAYKYYIEALYFPIPQQYTASGRALRQPKSYRTEVLTIIKRCNALHITPQLLINSTCEGENMLDKGFIKTVLRYIKKLKKIGLSSVIITNPVYISAIKQEMPDIRIESSVNCYVKTPEHALYLKELGADVITIDRDINRDISLISKIKQKTGLKIRIMLNEGCLRNCPYRVVHYNFLSHTQNNMIQKPKMHIDDVMCIRLYQKDPISVLRIPFIPPDMLEYYKDTADYYKISSRVFSTDRIEACLKAYGKQHFDGNLLEILDSPGLKYFEYIDYTAMKQHGYFKKMMRCSAGCNACGYCKMLYKKAVLPVRSKFAKRSREDECKAVTFNKKALRRAKNSKQQSYSNFMIGEAYYHLAEYKEAEKHILSALSSGYSSAKAYYVLGLCYEAEQCYAKAIDMLLKAESMDKGDVKVKLAVARCYQKTGNMVLFDKAIKDVMCLANASKASNKKELSVAE